MSGAKIITGLLEAIDVPSAIDEALIAPYKNDLAGMEEDELREAYREARDQLEEIEPWMEAITAYARREGIDLNP